MRKKQLSALKIYRLVYVERLRQVDVAALLGCSPTTIQYKTRQLRRTHPDLFPVPAIERKIQNTKRKPPRPSKKEIEVYRLVYIHGAKLQQAAAMLKCSEANVARHLARLRRKCPTLFSEKKWGNNHKPIRLGSIETGIEYQF